LIDYTVKLPEKLKKPDIHTPLVPGESFLLSSQAYFSRV